MPRTLIAVIRAGYLELRFGLWAVAREVDGWRQAARAIPDGPLREDALGALERKRANIDGAALFWTLPSRRCLELLRLLVAFEVLADFLDCVSERAPDPHNGQQLHRALHEALDATLTTSDYYRFHPWRDEGGYTLALVDRCRQALASLPSNKQVRPRLTRAAQLLQVLALNHDPDAARRDDSLCAWAATQFPHGESLAWFELAAAASAWLPVLALVAYAADPSGRPETAEAIYSAYMPWISLAGTMLDSYGDAEEDHAAGEHSYIAHYPPGQADRRVGELVRRAISEASQLPNGARHVAVASCMIAMYLSKDSSRAHARSAATRELARHAGSLQRLLIPVLRAWRVAYGQSSDRANRPPSGSHPCQPSRRQHRILAPPWFFDSSRIFRG